MEKVFKTQLVMLRQKKQLSQEALAAKLFVSRQAISKWENGESEPDIDKIVSMAAIFGVGLDFLLTGKQAASDVILQLTGLSKGYQRPILEQLDLSIYARDRVALLGSNGSGKSTLIRIIAGLETPDSGRVQFHFNQHDELSIMPQDNVLLETLSVAEQVRLSAAIQGVRGPGVVDQMLTDFQLVAQKRTRVGKLSGGQKRRLALLVSLVRQSKLLILDEPTVGMDLESIDLFWNYLEHIDGSVITVTHDFNQIDQYFSRVLLLKNGAIAADASVATIHSNNQTVEQWYRAHNHGGAEIDN